MMWLLFVVNLSYGFVLLISHRRFSLKFSSFLGQVRVFMALSKLKKRKRKEKIPENE